MFSSSNGLSYHYGVSYTFSNNYMYLNNSGYISTFSFTSLKTTNYGQITTNDFLCSDTTNYGEIDIAYSGLIDLGHFRLVKDGILNLNGFVFKGNMTLDPALKEYMEKHGGTITKDGDSLIFKGTFKLNVAELRAKLPQLLSKYDTVTSWWEYAPFRWFYSSYSRVESKSKKTGESKLWKFSPITDKYTITMATDAVYTGKLAHKLVACNLNAKTKFDVFSKAVVTREMANSSANSNQTLLTDVARAIMAKDPNSVLPMLTQLGTNKDSKIALINALTEILDSVSNDNYKICYDVKDSIIAELTQVNCRFTKQEIETQILPEVDVLIDTVKNNVAIADKYLEELKIGMEQTEAPRVTQRP